MIRKILILASVLLTACSLAPKYQLPIMPIPAHYKETGPWVRAKPSLMQSPRPWWTRYHDPLLNALEERVSCHNFNLKVALARFDNARAMADATRSARYPSVQGIGTVARQKNPIATASVNGASGKPNNVFLLVSVLNYEVDAWGRVRNAVIASDSLAKASAFDVATVDLSLHAELAADYFELRGDDEAQRVLDRRVRAYQKALYLMRQRHLGGMVPAADVDEIITQWENAKTKATEMQLTRAQLEHAIAILVGEVPANFHIEPKRTPLHWVSVATDLPSTLLERRPDVAAAAKRVEAANASIGVARAAFLPQFNLITLLGVQSNKIKNLFSSPSILWSLGPSTLLSLVQPEISQVIFDGFQLQALLNQAKASYFETINAYQETVLRAFRDVEDQLVAVRRLSEEKKTQSLATAAAHRTLYQANRRYQGGLVTYLDVVIYENDALNADLSLIAINVRRQLASVGLIKALGGGWDPH